VGKNKSIECNINGMDVIIEGNRVTCEFDMTSPTPSASGKRDLRFSTRGRQQIPGAEKGLVIMVNMDQQRS